MILIRHNGDLQLVRSLDGHPGAKVLARDIRPRPSDFHDLIDGKWVLDKDRREKARREATLLGYSRSQLVDHIKDEVADCRSAKGPPDVNKGSGGVVTPGKAGRAPRGS